MAGITLATAQATLDSYLAAEVKALAGQSYEIAGRKMTRADLAEIRAGVDVWNRRVIELSAKAAGQGRAYTFVTR